MSDKQMTILDGNEAAAWVAYKTSDASAIYPITPSTTMAEVADQWSAQGRKNIWGDVPNIVEMQSEAGAVGAVHGALQTGALTTTFTASQGLMLMIPNMYKIAGELTPCVIHVAARALATQGLSIFGDHQDIMAVRQTGFAMLAANGVQEAHDMSMVSHAATLEARIPFLHFFDGFRTSHEVNKIELLSDEQISEMIDDDLVRAHRARALNPDSPVLRGTAQNPDVYFQARESCNPYYAATPAIVEKYMAKLEKLTGRHYDLFEYHGAEDAERVIVIMGSGAQAVKATVDALNASGEKLGVLVVRLFRPFSVKHCLAALPKSVKKIAVLDRTKEPGSSGEPLYQEILTALAEGLGEGLIDSMPRVVGGRYGLSSKEFTPAMIKAIYEELLKDAPKNHFTIGIIDDKSNTSLDYDDSFVIEPDSVVRAMFFGLGSDGTVGANKNSIKIIGSEEEYFAQGYFVYDSKKSGSQTISHLRFGKQPIDMPYLVQTANFIGCHQFNFIYTTDILAQAAEGSVFLLNSPYSKDEVWDHLPQRMQQQIIDKGIKFYVIDALKVAMATGMGTRINTIMQTCFFALSGVMERDVAIEKIKNAIEKTYGKKGPEIVKKNFEAVDGSLADLFEVTVPAAATAAEQDVEVVPAHAPEFVKDVTARMIEGKGDLIPVSMLPDDGTYPTGTTQFEKRDIAAFIPGWEEDLCIQCGNCSLVCPHAAIRAKFYEADLLENAPEGFKSAGITARGFPEARYTLQVYPQDCTGCGLCVEACPAKSMKKSGFKAINMVDKMPIHAREVENLKFFESIPYNDRTEIDFSNVRGAQFLQPLFEFSGACTGCGETPYVKLISQLFGDRMLVANATGCSSIYGGNLPTTPWAKNDEGRGPAWCNSLFEDNAEFGFGYRMSIDAQTRMATRAILDMKDQLGSDEVDAILSADQNSESQIAEQRKRVAAMKEKLAAIDTNEAKNMTALIDQLVKRSVWIMGGDGWAYDIGSSGLDHVLASGENVNVLVMDTEVYSNTGGQASKSTPLAAVAKFAAGGKRIGKKDLALQAISYGNVYVAKISMGANPQQALQAIREAEAYPGPSLVIAYSHCIAHGINMTEGMEQQRRAVRSGHWALFRYNPEARDEGVNPFILDSLRPRITLKDYVYREVRYKMLQRAKPEEADQLLDLAQEVVEQKWGIYEEMATRSASEFTPAFKLND